MTSIEIIENNIKILKIANNNPKILMGWALLQAETMGCLPEFQERFKDQIKFLGEDYEEKVSLASEKWKQEQQRGGR